MATTGVVEWCRAMALTRSLLLGNDNPAGAGRSHSFRSYATNSMGSFRNPR
jgi:hypothetical protein